MAAGKGLYIVVNANAKRGGRRIAVQIARALPAATVRLTKSLQELEGWRRTIEEPRCILSAGGDGSAVALLNEPCGPDDAAVKELMSGNICRCGAYPNIVAAIQKVRKNA